MNEPIDGGVAITIPLTWDYDGATYIEIFAQLDYSHDIYPPSAWAQSIAFAPFEEQPTDTNSAVYESYAEVEVLMYLSDEAGVGELPEEPVPVIITPKVMNVIVGHDGATTYDPYSFEGNVGSGEQLKTVPVGAADLISVQFNRRVELTDSDLELIALNRVLTEPTPDLIQEPDASNDFTAVWKLSSPLQAAQYLMRLSDSIVDTSGSELALDGEWTNPGSVTTTATTSVFPSGDNIEGGDFEFVFTILPGDANRDSQVSGTDFGILLMYLNKTGMHTWANGDFNGNGSVTGSDYGILLQYLNKSDFRNLTVLGDYVTAFFDIDSNDESAFDAYYSTLNSAADLDKDGSVNPADESAFDELSNFGIHLSVLT